MSRVTVYAIRKNGDVEEIGEAHNAMAFVPVIWKYLALKTGVITSPDVYVDQEVLTRLWSKDTRQRLDLLDHTLLGLTFDRAYLKALRIPVLLAAIRRFNETYSDLNRGNPPAPVIAQIVEVELMRAPELHGICINGTSVSDSFWYYRRALGIDGKPLVGNGEPADWSAESLNIFEHKSNGRDPGEFFEIGDIEGFSS